MNTIVVSDKNSEPNRIMTVSGHPISVEACQDVFQQFTKPKTRLGKTYSDHLKINFEEIQHLDNMIMQSLQGEKVVAFNCSIIIVHQDKSQSMFDGFQEFQGYSVGGSSPTRMVVLLYRYAIKYGNKDELQNYEVKIELTSKLTSYSMLNNDKLPSPMKALLVRVMPTVELQVKYDDYLKAKVFVDLLDDWVKGCPNSDNYKTNVIRLLQNHSDSFSSLFSCIFIFSFMFYLQHNIEDFITTQSNVQDLAIFFIQVLGISYLIIIIARGVGNLVENFLDFFPFLSFIKINKGDEMLIDKRGDTLNKVIFKIFGSIVVGAIGSYLMAVVCGLFPSLKLGFS